MLRLLGSVGRSYQMPLTCAVWLAHHKGGEQFLKCEVHIRPLGRRLLAPSIENIRICVLTPTALPNSPSVTPSSILSLQRHISFCCPLVLYIVFFKFGSLQKLFIGTPKCVSSHAVRTGTSEDSHWI